MTDADADADAENHRVDDGDALRGGSDGEAASDATDGSDADTPGESRNGSGGESVDRAATSPADGREAVAPTVVFDLLRDETRLAIVRELARARQANWQWEGLSFADLRRAVGAEDAGNFSYHLQKLRGPLVVADGDEYVLRNLGLRLVGAIEASRHGDDECRTDATGYDCPIPDCDRALAVTYTDQYLRIHCPDHDTITQGTMLPPGVAESMTTEELVDVAVVENRQDVERARFGVCPHCWGPMQASVPAETVSLPAEFDDVVGEGSVFAGFECDRCEMSFDVPAGACVADHPAVVALYHRDGVDLRTRPWVTLPFVNPRRPVVESRDPTRVRVDVERGGESLSLWLDDAAEVVEYELT